MKRDCAMVLRFTKKELDKVTSEAHKVGMSREGYVRTVLNNSRIIPAPEIDYYPLIREMRCVGRSIDQVLAKANTIGFLDVLALRKALEDLHSSQIKSLAAFFHNRYYTA